MTITAIIVDDESHARQALGQLLADYPEIQVLAQCGNGVEAVKAVNDLNPMVVFLDIHMPKLDGFDVLELLGEAAPTVVFVTAHDDYAIQAFEKNALDYLLKPVSRERLQATIKRLQQQYPHDPGNQSSSTEKVVLEHQQTQAPVSRILVRNQADVHVIPTGNIVAIEAADDYVVIHTPEQSHIKQERLNNLEAILDPQQFCRIHRSCMINLDYIEGIETEGKDNRFALMSNNKQFAISRSGYSRLIKVL